MWCHQYLSIYDAISIDAANAIVVVVLLQDLRSTVACSYAIYKYVHMEIVNRPIHLLSRAQTNENLLNRVFFRLTNTQTFSNTHCVIRT